jgi:hypothetical protein
VLSSDSCCQFRQHPLNVTPSCPLTPPSCAAPLAWAASAAGLFATTSNVTAPPWSKSRKTWRAFLICTRLGLSLNLLKQESDLLFLCEHLLAVRESCEHGLSVRNFHPFTFVEQRLPKSFHFLDAVGLAIFVSAMGLEKPKVKPAILCLLSGFDPGFGALPACTNPRVN